MAASRKERDPRRESRITGDIIVDAYGAEEQAMGWYYYLEAQLTFPFSARCTSKRATSPLGLGDQVQVIALASDAECDHEMFVIVRNGKAKLAVPLSQITPDPSSGVATREAVADWHYWVRMGYEFG